MKVIKVGISACTGFDYPEGTLTRIIGYKVLEDLRPDSTVLICLPALAADVEEDIEFGEQYPSIVIEGCGEKCCTRVFSDKKLANNIKYTYNIQEIIKQNPKLKLDSATLLSSQPALNPNLEKTLDEIAEKIAQDIDKLLLEGK